MAFLRKRYDSSSEVIIAYYAGSGDSDVSLFDRREFSFTIDKDEIYVRYQSFADASELSAAIMRMQPSKIDIGAIFTFPVCICFTT